jgi:hypothetical protein
VLIFDIPRYTLSLLSLALFGVRRQTDRVVASNASVSMIIPTFNGGSGLDPSISRCTDKHCGHSKSLPWMTVQPRGGVPGGIELGRHAATGGGLSRRASASQSYASNNASFKRSSAACIANWRTRLPKSSMLKVNGRFDALFLRKWGAQVARLLAYMDE